MTIITPLTGSTSTATTNGFFDKPTDLAPATKARSADINTLSSAVDTGFDNVQALVDTMATPQQMHSGGGNYIVDAGTAANAVIAPLDATITALADGMEFRVKLAYTLTGAATATLGALGTFPIRRPDGSNPAGDYVASQVVSLTYVAGGGGWLQLPALAAPAFVSSAGLPVSGGTMTGPLNQAKGGAVASAAILDLQNVTGNLVHVTGTASITSINLAAGAERTCIADGAFTLVGSGALNIPGGTTLTAAVGDRFRVVGDGSGNAIITHYQRANGGPVMTANFQVFTASGTFSPQPGATAYLVIAIGGGGGGGGAGSQSSGAGGATGGGGGAAGAIATAIIPASLISSAVAVTVGAAGTGGTGSIGTFGNAGSAGGNSSFGSFLFAAGGPGSPAQAGVATPATSSFAPSLVGNIAKGSPSGSGDLGAGTVATSPSAIGYASPTSGGGGAGTLDSGTSGAGGAFTYQSITYAGGAAVAAGGIGGAGAAGSAFTIAGISIGTGGSGGGFSATATGGKGGNGGGPGAGGGGGGSGGNTSFIGGAGGDGYRGEVRVYCW